MKNAFDIARNMLSDGLSIELVCRYTELTRERVEQLMVRPEGAGVAENAFAAWIAELKQAGYRFSLVFFWLASPELAVNRVRERVLNGGHNIPEDVILRRYEAGLLNFFRVYRPIADHWRFYDNSNAFAPVKIACGEGDSRETVLMQGIWKSLKEKYL